MTVSKRQFLKMAGLSSVGFMGAGLLNAGGTSTTSVEPMTAVQSSTGLRPMTDGLKPISIEERQARVQKLQGLMQQAGISALVAEGGTSLMYFTGISWGRSERMTAAIIPAEGDIAYVTPFFEEPKLRERILFGDDVRTWHEHENPFERVIQLLNDRGFQNGKLALEETTRYFIADGLKKAGPNFELVSGTDVVLGCRMYKSTHEIQLMQAANDITVRAYQHVAQNIQKGMTGRDVGMMMRQAQIDLGARSLFTLVLLNEASAYPHGSKQPQVVEEGGIVLMDCGAEVLGYESDISRTFVYGEPSKRQREIWDLVREGQEVAFEAAKLGTPAGHVDDVVRKLYEARGFGPGYETPGLPHRTGHGIGMDGHESVNFVHNEQTVLAPGMCFSNEPGLYIYGEFGVRMEDCLYMTESGPKWFSKPSESLDNPFNL